MTATELNNYGTALPNLNMPIASNGDKRTPIAGGSNSSDTQASVQFGLPALMSEPLDEDGVPVPRQDLNGLYNMLSKVTHYLMAGGRIPWMQAEATAIGGYPNGAEVTYNGHNYKSLADSNTALPTDTTKWACIDYLPLTGGTMTGGIKLSSSNFNDAATYEILIGSGTTYNKDGACLSLRSRNYQNEDNKNGFEILCPHINNDGIAASLVGRQDGQLIWNNGSVSKNIVRSVNGVNADSDGNVSLVTKANHSLSEYFTWSGIADTPTVTMEKIGNLAIFHFSFFSNNSKVTLTKKSTITYVMGGFTQDCGSGRVPIGCYTDDSHLYIFTSGSGQLALNCNIFCWIS